MYSNCVSVVAVECQGAMIQSQIVNSRFLLMSAMEGPLLYLFNHTIFTNNANSLPI